MKVIQDEFTNLKISKQRRYQLRHRIKVINYRRKYRERNREIINKYERERRKAERKKKKR